MDLYNTSPEKAEKRRWTYHNLVRKNMNERFQAVLEYAGYTAEDLGWLLDRNPEVIDKYMRDCTKIPVDELWLIALFCNVRIDCFPDTKFYFDLEDEEV